MITLIATDGSGVKNKMSRSGFDAAAAFVYESYEGEQMIAKGCKARYLGATTSNMGEIMALHMALKFFEDIKDVEGNAFYFLLDSDYVRKAVLFWLRAWEKNRKNSPDGIARTSTGNPVKHYELFKEVHELYFSYPRKWMFKVRSHVGEYEGEENEAYKEFLQVNNIEVTRELWEKCNQLNQEVDALVHECAKSHEDVEK